MLDGGKWVEPKQDLSAVLTGEMKEYNHTPQLQADSDGRMWLAFPTLFDFGEVGELPEAFRPTCHIFYGQRVVDMADGLPKWSGHKNASERIGV